MILFHIFIKRLMIIFHLIIFQENALLFVLNKLYFYLPLYINIHKLFTKKTKNNSTELKRNLNKSILIF